MQCDTGSSEKKKYINENVGTCKVKTSTYAVSLEVSQCFKYTTYLLQM